MSMQELGLRADYLFRSLIVHYSDLFWSRLLDVDWDSISNNGGNLRPVQVQSYVFKANREQ